MVDRLIGIDQKIERAKKHVGELEIEVRRFIESNPYEIFSYCELDTRDILFAVNVYGDPPVEMSTVIGDVINNLRAALDHLFTQLMDLNGQTSGAGDYFPIANGPNHFEALMKGVKKKVGIAPMTLLKTTEAYKGGKGHGLWQLNELNNRDKHRLLVPVGSAYRHFTFDAATFFRNDPPDWLIGKDIPFMEIAINPADRLYPLKNGAVLLSYKAGIDPRHMDMNPKFAFGVAFGEGQIVEGEPLFPTLVQLADLVKGTIEPFRPLLM